MSAPARRRVERTWDVDTPSFELTDYLRAALAVLDTFDEPPPPSPPRKLRGDLLHQIRAEVGDEFDPEEKMYLAAIAQAIRDASATKLSTGGGSSYPMPDEKADALDFLRGWRYRVFARFIGADPARLRETLCRAGWWPADLDGTESDREPQGAAATPQRGG